VPEHALDGVTILEFAGWYAAPYGTAMNADLSARVIKVEPLEGDPFRAMGGTNQTAASKESMALNLQTEAGRRIAHQLVERADMVMHNYRPGVPERLGIDYATLSKINPRLVYLYGGLYGDSGPSMLLPGFHPTAGAVAGGALYQAGSALPPADSTSLSLKEITDISYRLAKANEGNPDTNGAVVVGTAMLMGLFARERTGKGQNMLTTMIGSNAYANSDDFITYAGKLPRPLPDAAGYGLGPLYRLYETKDGWVFLAVLTDEEWQTLCAGIERQDLVSDPRCATGEARNANAEALVQELAAAFKQRSAEEWEQRLTQQDVACVRADQGGLSWFLYSNPVLRDLGVVVEVDSPEVGRHRRHGVPVELSLTPGEAGPIPTLGQHTHPVLRELGYGDAEVDALQQQGVVLCADQPVLVRGGE
jgi:crotonobetainyl-CoA:carnitine CoA-transferase CaiB-like acyl-CoA transferase